MNIDFIDNVVDFLDSIDTVDWPVKSGESSKKNKEKLIILAKSGKERPNSRTRLGKALCHYTNKSNGSYDEQFDKEIKQIRINWFRIK